MTDFTPEVRRLLRAAGFAPLRPGKGDHYIWWNAETRLKVSVDARIKSRHTANGALKQAGLPKAF